VISNAPAAIGTVSMIGQPVNVTGVLALRPQSISRPLDRACWRGTPARTRCPGAAVLRSPSTRP
jgi:hypothetical protein